MEKKKTETGLTVPKLRLPALLPAQMANLSDRVLSLQPGSSRDNVALVFRALSAPSEQIRNLQGNHLLKPAIMAMAASYCGASGDDTLSLVWGECADWLRKHYPSLIPDELLEAFRFASSPQCAHPVKFAAYSGRFTVEILKQVMAAYMAERNAIHQAIERGLAQMTAEQMERLEEEKNRAAKAQFLADFLRMKAEGVVPEFDEIRFWWFDSLMEAGEISFPESEKRELWTQAAQILRWERTEELGGNPFRNAKIQNLIQQWDETESVPDEWKGKRELIYKRLLIRQALINAAMDSVDVEAPTRLDGSEDIPF